MFHKENEEVEQKALCSPSHLALRSSSQCVRQAGGASARPVLLCSALSPLLL